MAKLAQLKAEAVEQGYYSIDETQDDKDKKPKSEPKPRPAPEIIKPEPQEPAIAGVADVRQMVAVTVFMMSVLAIQAMAALGGKDPPKLPEFPRPETPLVAGVAGLALSVAVQSMTIRRTSMEVCKARHPERVGPCAEAIKELENAEIELRKMIVELTGGRQSATILSPSNALLKLKKFNALQVRYISAVIAVSKCLGCPDMTR